MPTNPICSTTPFSSCSLAGDIPFTTSVYCESDNQYVASCPPTGTSVDGFTTTLSAGASISSCYYCAPNTTTTVNPDSPNAGQSSSSKSTVTPSQSPPLTVAATTTPTSSTSQLSTGSSQTSNGLSKNQSAGVGIGGALGGALIAGLIVFLLFRRKRRHTSYPQQHLPPNGGEYVGQEKYGMVATTSAVKGAVVTNVDHFLPQPAEDDAIIGGLSKIRDAIKNHVQNYYHKSPVRIELVDERSLTELANATGIPTPDLLRLILNPATRAPTIRLFLGHLILSRCQGRTDGQPSLLPNEVSGLAAYNSGTDSCKSALSKNFSMFQLWS